MARWGQDLLAPSRGTLRLKSKGQGCVDVYFIPSKSSFDDMDSRLEEVDVSQAKLMQVNVWKQSVTIYPISTTPSPNYFLKQKYEKVSKVTLKDRYISHLSDLSRDHESETLTQKDIIRILEDLPSGFTKDFEYGLGLAHEYRAIINSIEDLSDCTEIVISNSKTGVVGDVFCISWKDFEIIRKSLSRVAGHAQSAARSVKGTEAYNILAEKLGRPSRPVNVGRHPLRTYFTAILQGEQSLTEEQKKAVLSVVAKNPRMLAEREPEELAKLQDDIGLVTLEQLVVRYRQLIGRKRHKEADWQNFFNQYPFILSLAFGYPVIKVQDQASMGGRKLSGSGDKIVDFLVKNGLTNNTAIIEIKTPKTKLLLEKPYRDGVYAPSRYLAGAISQVLDQRYRFQKEIDRLKSNSKIYDIESYFVHCCLIIGEMPSDEDRQKSFEMFRHNSKDVEIVTFDELLNKLENLYKFLESDKDAQHSENE